MSQHAALYNCSAWRKRRARHLHHNPLCVMCQARGIVTQANTVDHVTPHRGDPVLFAGPLQSLCPACHSRDKQQLERSGFVRGCDRDGVPLDPSHPWRQELERERADPGGGVHICTGVDPEHRSCKSVKQRFPLSRD